MKLSAFVRRSFSEVGPKILLFFLFSILYSLFSIQSVSAQSINQTPQNSYATPNTNPDVPKNLHTYTQSVMIEVMSALTCQLAGVDPTNPTGKCLGVDPKTGNIGFVEGGGGAVGVMGGLIGMMYRPPAHTVDYAINLAQNFGVNKTAYAQGVGVGFAGISPLINLWSKFRDIVYLLFVLVFVIVGVAIMLRVKIDPRTVMTIQNQIPKLIIGLLLVTFSFAIAGFLIDIMYIFIYLIINVLDPGQSTPKLYASPFGVAQHTFNIFEIAFKASVGIGAIVSGLAGSIMNSVIGGVVSTLGMFAMLGPLGGAASVECLILDAIPHLSNIHGLGWIDWIPFGGSIPFLGGGGPECGFIDMAKNIPGIIVGGLIGMIAFLVILIAILWALFRLWFTLLSAYIMILINIVFAPFWIVAGLFPGSSIGFTAWLRSLVANLAVFPATIVMFLLGKQFMEIFGQSGGRMFVPPLIGNPNTADHFGAIIGLGIILTTPNIVKTLREALKAPKVDLSAVGAAVGAGAGTISGTVRQTAGSVFVAREGAYPTATERGLGAIARRFLTR